MSRYSTTAWAARIRSWDRVKRASCRDKNLASGRLCDSKWRHVFINSHFSRSSSEQEALYVSIRDSISSIRLATEWKWKSSYLLEPVCPFQLRWLDPEWAFQGQSHQMSKCQTLGFVPRSVESTNYSTENITTNKFWSSKPFDGCAPRHWFSHSCAS